MFIAIPNECMHDERKIGEKKQSISYIIAKLSARYSDEIEFCAQQLFVCVSITQKATTIITTTTQKQPRNKFKTENEDEKKQDFK